MSDCIVKIPVECNNCGGSGGISYSYEEQDTGLTWVDGKKIYQKTVECGNYGSAGITKSVPHLIENMDSLVEVIGLHKGPPEQGDTILDYLWVGPSNQTYYQHIAVTHTDIGIFTNHPSVAGSTSFSVTATIRYTCTDR